MAPPRPNSPLLHRPTSSGSSQERESLADSLADYESELERLRELEEELRPAPGKVTRHHVRGRKHGTRPGGISALLDRARNGSGDALPIVLRQRLEEALGTDLKAIRLHTGEHAAEAASAIAAKAFTVGKDVFFGEGEFDPSSERGQHLIAHEVAHTVQQDGAVHAPQAKLRVSRSEDRHEVEADRFADAFIGGREASVSRGSVSSMGIHRQRDERAQTVAPTELEVLADWSNDDEDTQERFQLLADSASRRALDLLDAPGMARFAVIRAWKETARAARLVVETNAEDRELLAEHIYEHNRLAREAVELHRWYDGIVESLRNGPVLENIDVQVTGADSPREQINVAADFEAGTESSERLVHVLAYNGEFNQFLGTIRTMSPGEHDFEESFATRELGLPVGRHSIRVEVWGEQPEAGQGMPIVSDEIQVNITIDRTIEQRTELDDRLEASIAEGLDSGEITQALWEGFILLVGTVELVDMAIADLNRLRDTSVGSNLLTRLAQRATEESGDLTIVLNEGDSNSAGQTADYGAAGEPMPVNPSLDRQQRYPVTPEGDVITGGPGVGMPLGNIFLTYDPTTDFETVEGEDATYPFVTLGHELMHALNAAEGRTITFVGDALDNNQEESRVIGLHGYSDESLSENSLRRELGLEERDSHRSITGPEGRGEVFPEDIAPPTVTAVRVVRDVGMFNVAGAVDGDGSFEIRVEVCFYVDNSPVFSISDLVQPWAPPFFGISAPERLFDVESGRHDVWVEVRPIYEANAPLRGGDAAQLPGELWRSEVQTVEFGQGDIYQEPQLFGDWAAEESGVTTEFQEVGITQEEDAFRLIAEARASVDIGQLYELVVAVDAPELDIAQGIREYVSRSGWFDHRLSIENIVRELPEGVRRFRFLVAFTYYGVLGDEFVSEYFELPDEDVAVARKADGSGISQRAQSAVMTARGGRGDALPAELKGRLEQFSGADLSELSVFTGAGSANAAKELGAHAYAENQAIHFAAGTYDPSSRAGQELIAHEVAHTIQARGGATGLHTKLTVSTPGDRHEREADAFAAAFVGSASSFALSAATTSDALSLRAEAPVVTNDDRERASATMAQQQELSSYEHVVIAYEMEMHRLMQDAGQRGLFPESLVTTWFELSSAMTLLRPQIVAGDVSRDLAEAAAAAADRFHTIISGETGNEWEYVRPAGGYGDGAAAANMNVQHTNRYTGELRVQMLFGERTIGPDLGRDLRQRYYDRALLKYERVLEGALAWASTCFERAAASATGQEREVLESQSRAASGLDVMREELHEIRDKNPTPVAAVFQPARELTDGDERFASETAIQQPLMLFYWEEDGEWKLHDVTNPGRTFTDNVRKQAGETAPPRRLFEELDYSRHFPRGTIFYTDPGSGERVELTIESERTVSEWLMWAGAGLAVTGVVVLLTVGTGGLAAVVFVGAAVAGSASAGLEMAELADHGALDGTTVVLNTLDIISNLASLGGLAAGKAITRATLRGSRSMLFARLGAMQRARQVLIGTALVADGTALVILSADAVEQLTALDDGPGSDEEKNRARLLLLAQIAVTGGLMVLSVRGDVTDLRGQRNLYVHDVNGRPVVSASPEPPSISREGAEEVVEEAAEESLEGSVRERDGGTSSTTDASMASRVLADGNYIASRNYGSAEDAADAARAAGRESGAAAEIRVGGRVYTGVSGDDVPANDQVLAVLMGTPAARRAPWHGGCAEVAALNKALNDGVDVRGASGRAVNIGVSGSGHGTPKLCCSSCMYMFAQFGIREVGR